MIQYKLYDSMLHGTLTYATHDMYAMCNTTRKGYA